MPQREGISPKAPVQQELTPDQQQTVYLIEKRVKAFNEWRRSRMIQIKANIAYLCGKQNIMVKAGTIAPAPKEYETEVICNLILPAVVNDIATAGKVPASYDVVPAGTDRDDKATAMACQKILPYLKRINGDNLARDSVILWYDIDGVGWRKVYWDQFDSVQGINPPADHPAHNPNLEEGAPIYQGEVRVEAVPNTEVIFDHRARDLSNLEWVIHAKTITVGKARELFGEQFVTGIDEDAFIDGAERSEFEVAVMGDFDNLANAVAPNLPKDNKTAEYIDDDRLIPYYEYWQRPTRNMPTGMYAVYCGGKLAQEQPYPVDQYPHKQLPLIPTSPIPLTGIQPGSVSRISQARPLQREYNKLRSLILDNLDAMGNSVLMASRDSEIEYRRMSNMAGNIIEYSGPFKPTRESGQAPPGQIFAYMTEVKRGINEIFAFHEPTKGQMPVGGPKSAKGLETLMSADFTQLGPMIEALEASDQKAVYQMLTLAMANYGPRNLNIVGEDHAWTLLEVNPQELKGKINVIVKRGSSTPYNRETESSRAFNIWQSGLLGDPFDPQVRLYTIKQMQLGNVENILQSNAKHISFANNEFLSAEKLLENTPPLTEQLSPDEMMAFMEQHIFLPPPNDFDDHHAHINEHTDFLMSRYWNYVQQGPMYQILLQAMLQHNNMHKQMILQQQQAAQMAQIEAEAFTKGNTMPQLDVKHADRESA